VVEDKLAGILNKVKAVTKQAADATVRQAKIARLRFDLMAVHSEKGKYLQNMGNHLFSLYKQKAKFTGTQLLSDLETEIEAIETLDRRAEAIEAQLQAQQEDTIEVKDITPD